jgi:hypothetical protein
MKKGALLTILTAVMLLAVAVTAEAQQPTKVMRIEGSAVGVGPD